MDKPIGTLLLLWPTLWALVISYGTKPYQLIMFGIFILGVFLMRSAGCVINDIADRKFDGKVERTRNRPLVNQKIPLYNAYIFFFILLLMAACLLMFLNQGCFYIALVGALFTAFYPFTKRFFIFPQLILGFTFALGVLMAGFAVNKAISMPIALLYLLCVIWIFTFDSIYALVDIKDDLKININSSAIALADKAYITIIFLYGLQSILWLFLAYILPFNRIFYAAWFLGSCVLVHQVFLIQEDKGTSYFKAFLLNNRYGYIMFLGLLLAYF